jgi:transcriptional regulator with XRE-family HTH domain
MEKKHRFFPNTLRLQRRTLGYTQRQVASLLGLNDTVPLSQWERGRKLPSTVNLIKLCILYEVLPNTIFPDLFNEFRVLIEKTEFEYFQNV